MLNKEPVASTTNEFLKCIYYYIISNLFLYTVDTIFFQNNAKILCCFNNYNIISYKSITMYHIIVV